MPSNHELKPGMMIYLKRFHGMPARAVLQQRFTGNFYLHSPTGTKTQYQYAQGWWIKLTYAENKTIKLGPKTPQIFLDDEALETIQPNANYLVNTD